MTGVRTSSTMRRLNGPVMHDPERTDLPVRCAVAIEQQVIGNPVAAARDRDAFVAGNGTLHMIAMLGSFRLNRAISAHRSRCAARPARRSSI
jgi:hypothetical protein